MTSHALRYAGSLQQRRSTNPNFASQRLTTVLVYMRMFTTGLWYRGLNADLQVKHQTHAKVGARRANDAHSAARIPKLENVVALR